MSEENNNSNNDLSRDEIDEQLEALCQDQQDDKNECETMTMCYQIDCIPDWDDSRSEAYPFINFLLAIVFGFVLFIVDLFYLGCFVITHPLFIIHPVKTWRDINLYCTLFLDMLSDLKLSEWLPMLLGYLSALGGLIFLIYWLIKKFLF